MTHISFRTRIDRKMSSAHTNYKLDEAQAIMSELRTIKKAICTGEKERRDLMQVRGPGALQSARPSVCPPACLLTLFKNLKKIYMYISTIYIMYLLYNHTYFKDIHVCIIYMYI